MIPTPNLDHISSKDYEHVYEPAGKLIKSLLFDYKNANNSNSKSILLEDTFLLLDALEKDAEFLRNEVRPCICLEIGSVKKIFCNATL